MKHRMRARARNASGRRLCLSEALHGLSEYIDREGADGIEEELEG